MRYPSRNGGRAISGSSETKKDASVREQLRKKHIFCDLINGTIFRGWSRLKPEMLTWLPESSVLKLKGKRGRSIRLEQVRDVAYLAQLPREHRAIFRVIYGGEGQSYIDYGMAIRDQGYDAAAYLTQLYARRQKRREERSLEAGDEFLSGIKKDDRFVPVVTLCLYYGEKEWDAAVRLFELLDIPEGEEWIYKYLSDYRLNLVHAGNVEPKNYRTGLRQVFELLPFSGDAGKLREYVEKHRAEYENVSEETCELLLTFMDDKEMKIFEGKNQYYNKEGGGYDMCTAFRQMREEGIQIGEKRGIQIGEKRGEERVNQLIRMLLQENRGNEISKSVSDRAYQEKLFSEYGI